MSCRIAQDDPGFFILLAGQELMWGIAGTVETQTRLNSNKSAAPPKKDHRKRIQVPKTFQSVSLFIYSETFYLKNRQKVCTNHLVRI
jgi:hypothetical protein